MATLTLTAAANEAALLLGVLDSSEGLSTQQVADALLIGNQLADSWSSDPKMITSLSKISWVLTAATQGYTIGTGQVINVTRPVAFVSASLLNSSGPGNPIKVCNALEWEAIEDRQRTSFRVDHLFYDRGSPTGNVYVSPLPAASAVLTVEALVWAALAPFADATTPLTMLPGYSRLFVYSLGLEMAPQYETTPSATFMKNYAEALANVQALNAALFGSLTPEQRAAMQQQAAG